ncbi:DDE-domain-containing protein [Zopfia rhizophila CBS 207.26]|uniref:DDE-domain-containing protein n=1 Tax=Zopfia rhizophila CBS 207.26 TaxID=1314779 RepID=A0A6A6E593_9PEZI|nr:DDE-domain-containing protein [Zopfia rhizophila CBS 207.26]
MDNFLADIIALELAPPPVNIRIEFLPKNSTSMFQPLDQGIIQNFKAQYRKFWLQFSITCYNTDKDPVKEVTLENALRWTLQAWNFKVLPATIQNCWKKSTITMDDTIVVSPKVEDLTPLFQQAAQASSVEDVRDYEDFINPEGENTEVEEDNNVNLQEIVDHHTGNAGLDNVLEEDDEPAPVPTVHEALAALHVVQRYQEHQEGIKREDITSLQRLERELDLRAFNSQKQSTLEGWLKRQ